MKPATTLLGALIQQRCLTQREVVKVLERRARLLGEDEERYFTISERHLQRLVSGRAGMPHPLARRVLQAEFGYPIDKLLSPPPAVAAVSAPTPPSGGRPPSLRIVKNAKYRIAMVVEDRHKVPQERVSS